MNEDDYRSLIIAHGFPTKRASLIKAFVGGSALHGVKLEGTDDLDLYGIYIEVPELIMGLDKMDHFITSTPAQEQRNTDIDITCYSLRKFFYLAVNGNPTILQFFFIPAHQSEPIWSKILGSRELFLAKTAGKKYRGYADAQLHRMMGLKGKSKHGQRPELEERFGFDTKAAMHVLRVLLEGTQLLKEAWISFPRPKEERDWLLSVRRGERSMDWVIGEANRMFKENQDAENGSTLPETPNGDDISRLCADIYLKFWGTIYAATTDKSLSSVSASNPSGVLPEPSSQFGEIKT